jgi:hypothetical protein
MTSRIVAFHSFNSGQFARHARTDDVLAQNSSSTLAIRW